MKVAYLISLQYRLQIAYQNLYWNWKHCISQNKLFGSWESVLYGVSEFTQSHVWSYMGYIWYGSGTVVDEASKPVL